MHFCASRMNILATNQFVKTTPNTKNPLVVEINSGHANFFQRGFELMGVDLLEFYHEIELV